MTGFIVSVFPFRNRVSFKEAFEGLELGEGKPSRPVLRGPGGRKAAWLLGSNRFVRRISTDKRACVDWSGDLPLGPQFGGFGLPATKQITWPNVPYERPDTW